MCYEMDEEVGRINRGGEGESGQVGYLCVFSDIQ